MSKSTKQLTQAEKQKIEMTSGVGKCRYIATSAGAQQPLRRLIHHGPDTLEELFDRHVAKKDRSLITDNDEENEFLNRQRLTSTRREALSLYRDVIRATRFFTWPDSRGVIWRDVLRDNARKEFEAARFEKDPEVVTRLIVSGRDSVQAALDKLVEKQRQQVAKEQAERERDRR